MDTYFAMPAFLIVVLVAQHFDQKAQQILSAEEKARLSDLNSESYKWMMIPLIILLLAYGAYEYYRPKGGGMTSGLMVFVVMTVAVIVGFEHRLSQRLAALNLPQLYRTQSRKLRIARVMGSLLFLGWMLGSTISDINRMEQQMESLKKLSPPKP